MPRWLVRYDSPPGRGHHWEFENRHRNSQRYMHACRCPKTRKVPRALPPRFGVRGPTQCTKEPGLNRDPRPTGPLLSTTSSRKRMGVAAQFSCGG
ncbi:hypothetical protein QR685DRAFT_331285 [Neurospora intermedia]|uniref:Uncharacterized protein n=1 Tax=Neurospora intermedia TaxID=5142 RepID=A0ABR3D6Z5_NEUIN